jgi:hypothetical protein
MTKGIFRPILASLLLATPPAMAVGVGDIVLLSRLGERLQAEITLQLNGQETLDASCFSLRGGDAGDLPAITRARIRLWRNESSAKLLIDGQAPLLDPLALLRLQAGCGLGWQRDYILAPDSPSPTQSQPLIVPTSRAPAAMSDPAPITSPAARPAIPSAKAHKQPPKPSAPPAAKPKAVPQASPQIASSGPRLQLGAPPADLAAAPVQAQVEEMEIRMLRMEDSLHSLKSEVDKLHEAMETGARAAQARHELQLAQQLSLPQASTESSAAVPATAVPSGGIDWMALLLAALGGGLVSSVFAAILIRRSLPRARP